MVADGRHVDAGAEPKRGDALQLIFSIFLGVLIVVVVGVGVWTFYPPPDSENSPKQQEIQKLYREQEQYNIKLGGGSLEATQQAEYERLQKRINALQDEIQEIRRTWAVNTSIIVISIATFLMAVSLFLPELARVFSNGILLGGLFTVLYGTGVSFVGGDSRARFYVVLAALVLSLAVGYLRFVLRSRQIAERPAVTTAPSGAAGVPVSGPADAGAMASLNARVTELERRAAAAAAALGEPRDRD